VASDTSVGKSILVVDDEMNFVILLERVLSKRGYLVRTALNGEEALRLSKNTAFDLAVLDIRMGPMDGLTLLAELRKSAPHMKTIIMTAFPTFETRLTSFKRGASAYVAKPVNLSTLVATIGELVSHE
jgi:DNA-binding NtrC family response regulator